MHPTTRMCLDSLHAFMDFARKERSTTEIGVLDYGTGTGILAIAAKKFGAGFVTGVDVCDASLLSATRNSICNGVEVEFVRPEDLCPRATYDVVICNIKDVVLTTLVETLSAHVAPGGTIILSGIVSENAEAVRAAFLSWFLFLDAMVGCTETEAWVCLTAVRRKHTT